MRRSSGRQSTGASYRSQLVIFAFDLILQALFCPGINRPDG